MGIDNLAQANAEIEKLWRRLERVERGAPIGFSSVTRGALRILSPEGLIVDGSARVSGVLAVTGTENVSGTLNVTGTLNADGTVTLDGNVNITGPLTVAGATNITGPLTTKGVTRLEGDTTQAGPFHIVGATDLNGNLAVKSGGKITVEGAVAATLDNGKLSFASGGELTSYPTGATLRTLAGSSRVYVENGSTGIVFGGTSVLCSVDGVEIGGAMVVQGNVNVQGGITTSLPLKSGAASNVHVDSGGKLWRTS